MHRREYVCYTNRNSAYLEYSVFISLMAFLQSIADTVRGAFSSKSESVVGIDIGSSFLKVVQLKRRGGKAVLETYGEIALGPYAGLSVGQATSLPPEKVTEAIKDLFREANVTTKRAMISIPLSASLLSVIKMPAMDEKQLDRMIPIEARKFIPVPIGEVTMDWWIVPSSAESSMDSEQQAEGAGKKIEVLVVAIHNEVLQAYKSISDKIPLPSPAYELEVFSTARSSFGNSLGPLMVMDMGAGTTKIAVVEYGIIRGQHIIGRGGQDITQGISQSLGINIARAEELKRAAGLTGKEGDQKVASDTALLTLEHIFSESNRVLLNYERTHGKTIKNVVLTGGGALLKGFLPFAQARMETEVTYADPFAKTEAPAFLAPVLREAGPEFAVAIGLALRALESAS